MQSNSIFKTLVMLLAVGLPCSVPHVSANTDRDLATPIAYESCNNHRLLNPFFTTDLVVRRHMYVADLSTVGAVLTGESAATAAAPAGASLNGDLAATQASISLKIISSSVVLITLSSTSFFISAILGAVSSGAESPAITLL